MKQLLKWGNGVIRLHIEWDGIAGHGLIVRFPLGFGISFWGFHWWSWMFGLAFGPDDHFLEWHLGPFAGEMWREDIAVLKMTPTEYELKIYREGEMFRKKLFAEERTIESARAFAHIPDHEHFCTLVDALADLDRLNPSPACGCEMQGKCQCGGRKEEG